MKQFFIIGCIIVVAGSLKGQTDTLGAFTLSRAINYALEHQPVISQSRIDEELAEESIRSRLSDWYPQVNFNYNLQHNFVVQTAIIGGNKVKLGVDNTSAFQFGLSQTLFSRDLLLASRTRNQVRQQARQSSGNQKIELAVAVSKAFYEVLASGQQVRVSEENIGRIERSLQDAFNQYQAGITDKTDYKRATIALNNARAQKKASEELKKASLAQLKSLLGFPSSDSLAIVYDSLTLEKEVILDTLATPDYSARIEYKLLETRQQLLAAGLRYARWSYLPNVSASGAYNFNYLNNQFAQLYQINYPNSFAALTFSLPIFQGGKRRSEIREASWMVQRNRLELQSLKNEIDAGYQQALAGYKSNLAAFMALKENLGLAEEVYEIIRLQYRAGIKSYLEVINAETDLRTARINYYQSLYDVLASKIDVRRALGLINY